MASVELSGLADIFLENDLDTPPLGGLARFDDYIARYIGFGNWP